MSGYESDFTNFVGALATATAAAVVMPYASPIVGLMSLVVGDPHAQSQGADQWLDPNAVNIGPATAPTAPGASPLLTTTRQEWHAPMVAPARAGHPAGASDIAYLRSELQRLSREIGESEDWEGRAYNSFKAKVEVLDGHLATLDENRVACGNALKCSATGYHALMWICVAVAGILAALAIYVTACRSTVAGAAPGEATAMRAVLKLHETLSSMFKKHWKLVLKISALLAAAGIAYNQFSQSLPGMQAAPTEKPNLIEAGAIYDPTSADITDDPTSQFDPDQMDTPSFMPEVGW